MNIQIFALWVGMDYSAITCFAELIKLFSKMTMFLFFQVLANKLLSFLSSYKREDICNWTVAGLLKR